MVFRFIATKYNNAVQRFWRGLDEVPELYGTTFLITVGVIGVIYKATTEPEGGKMVRYKDRYMIMRPDDEKLVAYPKSYVTDQHLLK